MDTIGTRQVDAYTTPSTLFLNQGEGQMCPGTCILHQTEKRMIG